MRKNLIAVLCIFFCFMVILIFGPLLIGKIPSEKNQSDRFEDKMMTTAFSANVVGERGTIVMVLAETNGISQVRVSYGKQGYEPYALAPMPVTNGQPVKVIGVTARHSEAPGVLPSFTRIALPY